ncbi:hypothetical protein JW916_10785 [Candidatus Sumerlaeota bacterium]|nr:hypothetical protein [Candidatus Sumerlaeota bacterium]
MRQRTLPRSAAVCVLVAAAILSSACATGYNVRRISDRAYAPRPRDYKIALTENDFKEPYVEIAQVTTRYYEDRLVDQLGRVDLSRAARKLGGDAVIRIARNAILGQEAAYRPGALFHRGTQFVDKYSLTGIVVRFARDESQ